VGAFLHAATQLAISLQKSRTTEKTRTHHKRLKQHRVPSSRPSDVEMRLYDRAGRRLYLNRAERKQFARSARAESPAMYLLCLTLLYTGCRISEALALTPQSFQRSSLSLSLVTLKRRRPGVVREIPVPRDLFAALDRVPEAPTSRLFPVHRATAWRMVKAVLARASISGAQAMPKGLRHGFGVNAIQCGVPLNLLARWMGHANMKTTAIYADATGPEERQIAARMW